MKAPPMLATLRHHKAGVILIALQIALTLAIVCNALFIIGQRIERMTRPTGIDGRDLFVVSQRWLDVPANEGDKAADILDTRLLADLTTLRKLPDITAVAPVNSVPLFGAGSRGGLVFVRPNQRGANSAVTLFFSDDQLFRALGLRVIAGRAFTPADVHHRTYRSTKVVSSTAIITRALAEKLFPSGNALGKRIYFGSEPNGVTIVGIVDRMESSMTFSSVSPYAFNAVIRPTRLDYSISRYAVRTKPGRMQAAMREARKALYRANPLRVIGDDGIIPFADVRANAYRADRSMAILMGLICTVLLCVTAAGIIGLTSFWVGQREKQVGVRRALGARQRDILHYFQVENLVVAGGGAVLGVLLAVGLNLWLVTHYELARLPIAYVLAGSGVVLALGQAAVFVPARRASGVPPAVATRRV